MLKFLLLVGLLFSITSCATHEKYQESDSKLPIWLQERLRMQPVPVKKYIHKGNEYFLVDYKRICCDMSSELFDDNGILICRPSGGFTGAGDMNCPCFVSEFLDLTYCKK